MTWLVSAPARFWEPLCLAVGLGTARNHALYPEESDALLASTKAAWVVHENRESFKLFTIEDDTQLKIFIASLSFGREEVKTEERDLSYRDLSGFWRVATRRSEGAFNVSVIDRLASLGSPTLPRIMLW